MLYRMNAALLLALGLCLAPGRVVAAPTGGEQKLSILELQVAVGVIPQVAPPGTARKIVVAGLWPNGCVPTDAELGQAPGNGKPTIAVLLTEPMTFAACTAALTPYRFEIDYTPHAAGQLDIVAMTTLSKAVGKGTLVTGSASDPRSIHDISGAWYDPQIWGTGLLIAHDYGQSDTVFAAWTTYEATSGEPRWFSLQQGRWQANGLVWEGVLYETKNGPCPTCLQPNEQVIFRGRAVLTFSVNVANGGLDAAFDVEPPDGPQQRLSNLRRFQPYRVVIQ